MTDPYGRFARFYDRWAAKAQEDVGFYGRLAERAGDPVLELGCGSGRVAIPLARAGRQVLGVDVSATMLALARERAHTAGVADRVTFVEGDMRSFVADPPVPLAIIPFRSFLHLTTTEDQLACLRAVHASLVPGGRLALNVFIPDPALIARRDGERQLEGTFVDDEGRRCEMWSDVRYEVVTQRQHLLAICLVFEGDEVVERIEAPLQVRMVYRYEMEHLLARAGFEIEAVYGWFDERPLTEECREMIWVARKP